MTDTDRPSRPTPLSVFRSLTLAQSIVIVAIIAGGVALATLLPDGRFHDLAQVLIALVTGGGALGTAFLERRKTDDAEPPPAPPPPTGPRRVTRPGTEGFAVIDLLLWIVLLACIVIAGSLTGCGASALGVHVRAATIATSALEGVGPLVEAAVSHRIETECGPASAGDAACVQALRIELAPTIDAVDVPVISARAALGTYVGTLRLLLEADAGEDVDVLSAVGALAGRLAAAWPDLVAALRPLGVELPIPPYLELAAAVLGGAR